MTGSVGFGAIGVGNWGRMHARVYADTPGARLVGIAVLDTDRANRVAAWCGGDIPVYADYRELLADPTVRAVSIALPDFLHREVAVAAAQAGKDILLEKPLATTEYDARAILAAVETAGVTLMVDFHNRWSPPFAALKQSLENDELGAPQMISFRLNDTLFVPTRMLSWSAQSSVAWFLASHCLDTLLWLLEVREGSDAVERVFSVARSRMLKARGIDTPDFYQTVIEFRSGLVAHLENAWILPDGAPSVFDLQCEFVGEKGAYFIDGSYHGTQKILDRMTYPDALVSPTVHGRPTGFAIESIRHFARSRIEETPPLVDGRDGMAVTRLILAMEESARKELTVKVGNLYSD